MLCYPLSMEKHKKINRFEASPEPKECVINGKKVVLPTIDLTKPGACIPAIFDSREDDIYDQIYGRRK